MNAVARIICKLLREGHEICIELANDYSDTTYDLLSRNEDGTLFQIADDEEGGFGALEACGFKPEICITNNKITGRYWSEDEETTYDFILFVKSHDIISLLF